MLDFVTFKWKPAPGYRSKFTAEHVNVLARMIARHYSKLHRLTCITDDAAGIDSNIRVLPLWKDHASLPSAYGSRNPSCYRRLKLFSKEAAEFIGPRFVALDLDIVITADITPLFNRDEDFVAWKSNIPQGYYNGSLYMLRAGTRTQVWDKFHPQRSPMLTRQKRMFGSDQAWISLMLGPGEAVWTQKDGVYSFRLDLEHRLDHGRAIKLPELKPLPDNARIVVFHGAVDPWDNTGQSIPWVRRYWK